MRVLVGPTVIVCSFLALAACGGGGGGSGTGSSPPPQPANGAPVPFQAAGTTVTYPVNSASESTSASAVNGSNIFSAGNGGTVTITTDPNGNASNIRFDIIGPALHFTVEFGPADIPLISPITLNTLATNLRSLGTTPGLSGFVLAEQGLSHSSYGLWASNNVGTGQFGAFALGSITPAAAMPITGTATYNGSTIGVAGSTLGNSALTGSVQLQANFANSTVGTTISNLQFQNTVSNAVVIQPNLTGIATITGSQYSGNLAGGQLAGSSTGTFYGPAANETAGVWKAMGGGITAIGSYGAAR